MKSCVLLTPLFVVTATGHGASAASLAMNTDAVMVVAFTTVMELKAMLAQDSVIVPPPTSKFVPVRVTGMVVSW